LGGFKNHRPNAHYLSTHTPSNIKAFLKRADRQMLKHQLQVGALKW